MSRAAGMERASEKGWGTDLPREILTLVLLTLAPSDDASRAAAAVPSPDPFPHPCAASEGAWRVLTRVWVCGCSAPAAAGPPCCVAATATSGDCSMRPSLPLTLTHTHTHTHFPDTRRMARCTSLRRWLRVGVGLRWHSQVSAVLGCPHGARCAPCHAAGAHAQLP